MRFVLRKKMNFLKVMKFLLQHGQYFSGRGTNISLQDLERRVITEWLPASGYEYAEIPDVEVYIKADPQDAIYEYWLPVVKKQEDE